jgi:channel protein (hemolysin III family)
MLHFPSKIPELYHLPGFHEPASAISHLIGAIEFLVLGALLLWRGRGSRSRTAFLGVYAFTCVFMFSMSAVYHMLEKGSTTRAVLERLDHAAIFALIAGTFTPAHGILFRGWSRWGPLAAIWIAAITGITFKTLFLRQVPEWLGLTYYLALGWVGAISVAVLWSRYDWAFVRPVVLGGLAYSIGAVMDYFNWFVLVPGVIQPHELLHLAVLAGAAYHWRFVWQFADGRVGASGE